MADTPTLPPSNEPVTADEIRWTLEPAHNKDDDDPLDIYILDRDALVAYALEMQRDLRTLRLAYHVAVEKIFTLTTTITRYSQRVPQLIEEIRRLRGAR